MVYDWPGNVRELYNELRRYIMTGEVELRDEIAAEQMASTPAWQTVEGFSFAEHVESLERHLIAAALAETGGNKTYTAARLNLPIMTLRRKIKKYGLE